MRYKEFDNITDKVFQYFISEFEKCYDKSKMKKKTEILNYSSEIFRRWYYSPLQDRTILSPAQIINKMSKLFFNEKNVVVGEIKPISTRNNAGFRIQNFEFSLDAHPVVKDLELVLKYIEKTGSINIKDISKFKEIRKKLTFFEQEYLKLLFKTAIDFQLVEKLSSIHTTGEIYMVSENYNQFFEKGSRDIFFDICNNWIDNTCKNLNSLISYIDFELKKEFYSANEYVIMSDLVFDREILSEVIKQCASVREIQNSIFDLFDIELYKHIDEPFDKRSEEDDFYYKLAEYVGNGIENYFIIPLGHYLRLFDIVYEKQFNMAQSFKEFFYNKKVNDDNITTDFKPCFRYFVNHLGQEVFGIGYDFKIDEKFNDIDFETLLQYLSKDVYNYCFHKANRFSFAKIIIAENKKTNQQIEIKEDFDDLDFNSEILCSSNFIEMEIPVKMKLYEFAREFCYAFFEPMDSEINMYDSYDENLFTEVFSSTKRKNRIRAEKSNFLIDYIKNNSFILLTVKNKAGKKKFLVKFQKNGVMQNDKYYPDIINCGEEYQLKFFS